jgi:hypothetical protein
LRVGRVLDEVLFTHAGIDEVARRVHAVTDQERLRDELVAEYGRLVGYRSLAEWNRLVRVCEVLAIIGWGEQRPVEAVAEKWINGRYYTHLQDGTFAKVSDTEKGWLRRADSFVVDGGPELVDTTITTVDTQRNPLPKNPLRLVRSGNYQPTAQAFVDEAERLRRLMDTGLAKSYGPGFSYAGITLDFSYRQPGVSCDYFHAEAEVPSGFTGQAFVRPRLDVGRLSRHRGETRLLVTRHYTWVEGEAGLDTRMQTLAEELLEIIDTLAGKLAKKHPKYRVDTLRSDVEGIIAAWLPSGSSGSPVMASRP